MLSDSLQTTMAGGLFVLGWAICSWVVAVIARRLEGRATRISLKVRHFADWRWWGQLALLLYALGLLFLWVADGTLDVGDIGLRRMDLFLPAKTLVLVAVGALAFVWILWAWLLYERLRSLDHRLRLGSLGFSDLLAQALTQEAGLAILRGALIPLAGPYWGIWLAVGGRSCLTLALPQYRDQLGRPVYREWLFLEWALDWIGSVLFFASQSIWPGLIVRLLALITLRLVVGLWIRLRFCVDGA